MLKGVPRGGNGEIHTTLLRGECLRCDDNDHLSFEGGFAYTQHAITLKNDMCGIAGFLTKRMLDGSEATIQRMTDAIAYRGPDDSGFWIDAHDGIALGHRRLAIVDLSPLGHQPMHSTAGRYVIAFNGEIYNFKQLKNLLEHEGHVFQGGSDTEVMLAAFESWGVL